MNRAEARDRILRDAWTTGFPGSVLWQRLGSWFERNKTNFGLFICWPHGERDDPVGTRIGFFSADSPTRVIVVGWARFGKRDFDRLVREHRTLHVRVFGWLRIAKDVDPLAAAQSLGSVRVIGVSSAPSDVRAQLCAKAA